LSRAAAGTAIAGSRSPSALESPSGSGLPASVVVAGERGRHGAAVGAGDLDRFGLDHQVADGHHIALAH
jgi:hypothetical protein